MQPVTDETFDDIIKGTKPKFLFFHASWSGLSHAMFDTVESVARQFEDSASFFSADVDEMKDSIAKLGINRVPTIVAIKDSKMIGVRRGPIDRQNLGSFVSETLS